MTAIAAIAALMFAACDMSGDRSPGSAAASAPAAGPPSTSADSVASLPAGARRLTLTVGGMSCESCERTIAVMLRRTAGVHSAEVSVDRGEAVVTFDPARTSATALIAVVRQLGYRATAPGA